MSEPQVLFVTLRDTEDDRGTPLIDLECRLIDLLDGAANEWRQAMIDWQPVATIPNDGRMVLVYRPLATRTNDDPIAIKRTETENRWCWPATVPDGATPTNPTNGSCHVTHWAELIAPPNA